MSGKHQRHRPGKGRAEKMKVAGVRITPRDTRSNNGKYGLHTVVGVTDESRGTRDKFLGDGGSDKLTFELFSALFGPLLPSRRRRRQDERAGLVKQ